MIRLQHVTKSFVEGGHPRRILDNVSHTFPRGRISALLGRSGTGKSTLLNLIAGLDLPDSGEIFFDNLSLTQLNEHERTLVRRRQIGFVFQFFNLIPTLNVLENVMLPLELLGISPSHARERAFEMLAAVGVQARAETFPDTLSGGEQQRVAIARALVHEPNLILADEPTGNLDLETGEQVLDLLEALVRERGVTMIIATHSRAAVRRADAIWRIVHGQLVTDMSWPHA